MNPFNRIKTIFCLLFVLSVGTVAKLPWVQPSPQKVDQYMHIIQSEINRAMDSLKTEDGIRPVYLSLLFRQADNWEARYTSGVLESPNFQPLYEFTIQMEVRDSNDNSSRLFSGSYSPHPPLQLMRSGLDAPLAFRRFIWAVIDQFFHEKVMTLHARKEWLNNHHQKDTLREISRPQFFGKDIQYGKSFTLDTLEIHQQLRMQSSKLREQNFLLENRTVFRIWNSHWFFSDSRQNQSYYAQPEYSLIESYLSQNLDQYPIWNFTRISKHHYQKNIWSEFTLHRKSALDYLQKANQSRNLFSNYRGPVFLSRTSAGGAILEFFQKFWDEFSQPPSLDMEPSAYPQLSQLVHRRLLASGIDVLILPSLQFWQNTLLAGYYHRDHRGIPAQNHHFIENGLVKNIPCPPEPSPYCPSNSGGNSMYNEISPGVLKLEPTTQLIQDSSQLWKHFNATISEEGLEFGIILANNFDPEAFELIKHPSKQYLSVDTPPEQYAWFPKQKKRTPVSGFQLQLDLNNIRFLKNFGDSEYLFEPLFGRSVICPEAVIDLATLKDLKSFFYSKPLL